MFMCSKKYSVFKLKGASLIFKIYILLAYKLLQLALFASIYSTLHNQA